MDAGSPDAVVSGQPETACLMTFPAFREQWFTIGRLQPADGERGWIEKMLVG
jgi:hypothetical protein